MVNNELAARNFCELQKTVMGLPGIILWDKTFILCLPPNVSGFIVVVLCMFEGDTSLC